MNNVFARYDARLRHEGKHFHYFLQIWGLKTYLPIPMAARSKAWVCRRSPAGIAGSNPARDMDVSLLCLLCVVR